MASTISDTSVKDHFCIVLRSARFQNPWMLSSMAKMAISNMMAMGTSVYTTGRPSLYRNTLTMSRVSPARSWLVLPNSVQSVLPAGTRAKKAIAATATSEAT